MLWIFLLAFSLSRVNSQLLQPCSSSNEASGLQQSFEFTSGCLLVTERPCNSSTVLSTVTLDGTCDSLASCGSNGCVCLPELNLTTAVNDNTFAAFASPEVVCEINAVTVRFSKCAANAYGVFLEQLIVDGLSPSDGSSLKTDADNTCKGKIVFQTTRMLYEFKISNNLSACNTQYSSDGTTITVKNSVQAASVTPSGSIIRSAGLQVNFTCTYPTIVRSLIGPLNPMISTLIIPSTNSSGQYSATFGLWSDSTYTTALVSGNTVSVFQVIYGGIVTTFQEANLVLVINELYATPSSNPDDATKFSLVSSGCPDTTPLFPANITMNGVSKEVRFNFRAFVFKASPGSQIFFHATVELCQPSSTCPRSDCIGRRRREIKSKKILSLGPITITSHLEHQYVSQGQSTTERCVLSTDRKTSERRESYKIVFLHGFSDTMFSMCALLLLLVIGVFLFWYHQINNRLLFVAKNEKKAVALSPVAVIQKEYHL